MYQREPGPRGDLDGSSIVKTAGNNLGKAILETHMCVENDRGLPQESPDQELGPCEGLRQGLVESMRLLVPR